MRSLKTLARLAVPAAAVVLATPLLATPAAAQEPPPHTWVSPSMPYLINIAEDLTIPKALKISIDNQTELAARDVVVTIDTSALPATFRAELPGGDDGCSATATGATCTLAELAGNASHVYTVDLLPGDLGAGEVEGTISVTSRAANTPDEQSAETLVQRWGPGIDLVIGDVEDLQLAPGASAAVPIVVGNVGSTTADGVAVKLSTTHYLTLPTRYSNCAYSAAELALTCVFDQQVEPGAVFQVDPATPLKVGVADRAPGPATYGAHAQVTPLGDDDAALQRRGGGTELRLVPVASKRALERADDLNFDDNFVEVAVTVPKHAADSVAVGADVAGAIGETTTVKVGIRNDGPADTLVPGEGWASSAMVTLPAGLQVLAVGEECTPVEEGEPDWDRTGEPGGLTYLCFPSERVRAGTTYLFSFKVKVVGEPGAAGEIEVDGGVQDDDTANNTAPITPVLGTGGTGGGLPVTGADTAVLAGAGLLLLSGGFVALLVARRRRVVLVTEDFLRP